MRTSVKSALAALSAIVGLGVTVGTATARRFASNTSTFRISWTELNPLVLNGAVAAIRCPVTIEGSFHSRTISKVCGQLVGFVTRAKFNEARCVGGGATVQGETLPWHVRYESFVNNLPRIFTIVLQVVGMGMDASTSFSGICLYLTSGAHPARMRLEREIFGLLSDVEPDRATSIPKFGGGFLCPENGTMEGPSESVTVLNSATGITVSLVQ